jgi:tight adherence protein C
MTYAIFAELPSDTWLEAAGCLMVGLAVATAAHWIIAVLRSEDVKQGEEWRYDVSRINELRRLDWFYRVFQPVVQLLAKVNRKLFFESLAGIYREIQAAGLPRFWLPEEYLAKLQLIALGSAPVFVYLFLMWSGENGLVLAGLAVIFSAWLLRRRLAGRARWQLHQIKRRMPFLLDLLTLLMEAGSTFIGALKQAVVEFEGHPIATEFGRVLADMNLGKTRTEAFLAMRDRLSDDEITSIIGAIIQGELLGTPLANIFRTQADVLRIKRTQRAEMIAGEAGVNMLLPAVLVMLATVLIIIGPFLLNYLYFGLSL